MEPTTRKKVIIGLSVAIGLTVIFVALGASGKSAKKDEANPSGVPNTDNADNTDILGLTVPPHDVGGLTVPPHDVGGRLMHWTLNGVTTTGIVCSATPTVRSTGLGAHSDQALYGVPHVKCATFS